MSDNYKCADPSCIEDAVWAIYHGKIGTAYACEEHMVGVIESVSGGVFCFRLEVEETKEGLR